MSAKTNAPVRTAADNQLQKYFQDNKNLGTATTSTGNLDSNINASMTAGKNGPILLQDINYIDNIAHFARERIPERVVHAKGAAAFGEFEVTHDITQYTAASVFKTVGKKTPIAARFSQVVSKLGSQDSVRDIRGFALKFYTDEGIWDIVGNNTPTFFLRDPIMFPSFVHSQRNNPVTNLKDWDMFWDFISLRPETTATTMFLHSDRGIPDGHRHMNGYGINTFSLINGKDETVYCKFHYKTDQGIKNLDNDTAAQISASDPDYAVRDLYNAIATGNFPTWTFYIQVMTIQHTKACTFDPFDDTLIWPHAQYPLLPVGKITLNRNSANFFAESEQLAFSPSNLIPGVGASPDRVLQGRLFSYHDTHLYRLGPNFMQIPVNCPTSGVRNFQRDGHGTINNQGGAPNYHPNSFGGPISSEKAYSLQSKEYLLGEVIRYDTTADNNNFDQPRIFYTKVLNDTERNNLIQNLVTNIKNASPDIQQRAVANFAKVDMDFGRRLTMGVKKTTVAIV